MIRIGDRIKKRHHLAILMPGWIGVILDDVEAATLIYVSDPIGFDVPFAFPKKEGRAWVVLDARISKEIV